MAPSRKHSRAIDGETASGTGMPRSRRVLLLVDFIKCSAMDAYVRGYRVAVPADCTAAESEQRKEAALRLCGAMRSSTRRKRAAARWCSRPSPIDAHADDGTKPLGLTAHDPGRAGQPHAS
jgi:hypothetical protein